MSTTDDPHGEDRVVVEVCCVFDDGSGQESVFFTWRDVEAAAVPEIALQDWMVEPRKSFPHPTDPIIYSMLVAPGREADARAWLRSLRDAPQ
ncbi:MAG TPA: hypothetical protein VGR11_12700 [Solirubrobacteraceae bacterium]|nr:hypothetical protein [Solirubrobacteraceae bacterium]